MKPAFAMIVGLALGGALALAVLYVNPFTAVSAGDSGPDDWQLGYEFPDDALLVSHSGRQRLPVTPAGAEMLWERTVRQSLVTAVVLRDEDGLPVGTASRISLPSADSDLLTRGLIVNDYWLVTLPGEGTLAVRADSNLWPPVKEAAVPVWLLGREWEGPAVYHLTEGPDGRGFGAVRGLTGLFAGLDGRAFTRDELRRLDAGGLRFAGGLHLRLEDEGPPSGNDDAVPLGAVP